MIKLADMLCQQIGSRNQAGFAALVWFLGNLLFDYMSRLYQQIIS